MNWSEELVDQFAELWDWVVLSSSEDIPWSIEILEEFEHRWNNDRLIWNETMWEKVFQPFPDEQAISELLMIMKKEEECPF